MLGSIIIIAISVLVVFLILVECSWLQPKTSKIAFGALLYAWYATTTIWAANTKKLEKSIQAAGDPLYPSTSFWLTLLPQVLSCVLVTAVAGIKQFTSKVKVLDSGEGIWQVGWYAAGSGFYFGQLFTVAGLGAGAPGLVFGVKVLEPLSTSLLAIPVLGQRANWRLLAAVVAACSGILITVIGAHRGDNSHHGPGSEWKGILAAVFANLGFSSRACVMKKAYSQKKIAPLETFMKVNVVACACGVLMLIVWAIALAICPSRLMVRHERFVAGVIHEVGKAPWEWFSACLCYFLYQCSSILLLDCLLVETHALLVALKHIFVVILASVLSGSPLNALMIIGIVVASLGVFCYSVSPGETEEKVPILPQNDKVNDKVKSQEGEKAKMQKGTSLGLGFTLTALAILGLLSPLQYN